MEKSIELRPITFGKIYLMCCKYYGSNIFPAMYLGKTRSGMTRFVNLDQYPSNTSTSHYDVSKPQQQYWKRYWSNYGQMILNQRITEEQIFDLYPELIDIVKNQKHGLDQVILNAQKQLKRYGKDE